MRCNVGVGKEDLHLPRRPGPGGRLPSVSDGTHAAAYSYLPQAGLVERIRFSRSGQDRLTTTRQFDLLNRLTQISNTGGTGSTLASFSYTYNEANQRVRVDLADGSFWIYEYDALGQVISGKRYWSDGTPVAGQQFEYGFDDIGNRKMARRGGD